MNRLAGCIIAALVTCSFDPTVLVYAAGRSEIHWPNAVEILQGGLTEIRISGGTLAAVEGRVGQTPVYFQQSGASFTGLIGAGGHPRGAVGRRGRHGLTPPLTPGRDMTGRDLIGT